MIGYMTRRQHLRRAGLAAAGIGLAPLVQACAGATMPAAWSAAIPLDALLLVPADFADTKLREVQRLGERETRDGGKTVQVILEDDRIRVYHSVVVFPTEAAARAAVRAARQTGVGESWTVVPAAPALGQESVVLFGKQGTRDAITAVFHQGKVLVRLTLVGSTQLSEFAPYAQRAVERVRQGGAR